MNRLKLQKNLKEYPYIMLGRFKGPIILLIAELSITKN